jgi:hypothetical protein
MEEPNDYRRRNSSGEAIAVGMTVDRLDNYKRNGEVLVFNPHRGGRHLFLVRWRMNGRREDEWCSPELLYERGSRSMADAIPAADRSE